MMRVLLGGLLPGRRFRTLVTGRRGEVLVSRDSHAMVQLEGEAGPREVHGKAVVELIR